MIKSISGGGCWKLLDGCGLQEAFLSLCRSLVGWRADKWMGQLGTPECHKISSSTAPSPATLLGPACWGCGHEQKLQT